MIKEEEIYRIGRITRTHGVKGEVAMQFTDDVWDRVETDYLVLCVDGIFVPFFMEEYRFRSDTVALVKFMDYDTADQAKELCGVDVWFPHSLTPDRSDEPYSWMYFTGFSVVDEQAGVLGTIDYVDDTTANVLFHVGDTMVPAAEEFIVDIDHPGRVVRMRLPEGLLSLNEKS